MATLESLVRKIKSVEDLQSIVRTMKAMAAANLRQYERAVESLKDYHHTVELGLQIVLRRNGAKSAHKQSPRKKGPLLAVVIGTDYGFAGLDFRIECPTAIKALFLPRLAANL